MEDSLEDRPNALMAPFLLVSRRTSRENSLLRRTSTVCGRRGQRMCGDIRGQDGVVKIRFGLRPQQGICLDVTQKGDVSPQF